METLFTVILVVTSLIMIVAILLQSGKGSGLAAGFGGHSAGTKVFGGSGAGGFLLKMTVVLGAVFMISSMALSYMASRPKSALAGIESATSGQSKATQAETIITSGSGAAPAVSDTPAEAEAPSINFDAAPQADEEQADPAAAPTEDDSEKTE
ncbi:preprotein translocase subunit SecG [Bradymonas sediminis]|uniref:Protein-export membrane protein SecG n=1 Tax=Bradymonas sediminis TaxID=1548548 RepID=A0A2Z4FL79_9DELT|nr:preprotein translocase subunit SecG [Bradymonas sediminis]AWV89458.1 preprotein translocase subunit SecG [Bradymonas sediminis]TDP76816.1 protein translocase subunit secG [Bradymonas sediminis]